jgi:hypothetical protein
MKYRMGALTNLVLAGVGMSTSASATTVRPQVTGAAGADLGFHDRSIVVKKIGLLLREIELHGILGKSQPCKTCKEENCGEKNFHLPGSWFVRIAAHQISLAKTTDQFGYRILEALARCLSWQKSDELRAPMDENPVQFYA